MNLVEIAAGLACGAVIIASLNLAAGYFQDMAGALDLISKPDQLWGHIEQIEDPAERAIRWAKETEEELAPVLLEVGVE